MSFMVAASTGFSAAREIYAAGHKSSNKLHLDGNSAFTANRHNYAPVAFGATFAESDQAHENQLRAALLQLGGFRERFGIPTTYFLRDGKALLRMRPVATNCGELAMIAAASAWVRLGEPKPAPLALVSLAAPADHVFCAVGPRVKCANLGNNTVEELARSPLSADVWAVDPWLNVFCKLQDYPARAGEKFNKWHLANKRIAWGTGPQGAGWYPPLGDYARGFAAAGLVVTLG
ncbi:hypothetical protein [Shinella sp.]|uniref:hypothetical protein n=1 Tax=Shinella sp. TaxID=1870904 RepID=UPI0040360F9F